MGEGKADLSIVSKIALLFKGFIPIISNGNIITRNDVQLAATEGPLLFSPQTPHYCFNNWVFVTCSLLFLLLLIWRVPHSSFRI